VCEVHVGAAIANSLHELTVDLPSPPSESWVLGELDDSVLHLDVQSSSEFWVAWLTRVPAPMWWWPRKHELALN